MRLFCTFENINYIVMCFFVFVEKESIQNSCVQKACLGKMFPSKIIDLKLIYSEKKAQNNHSDYEKTIRNSSTKSLS